MDDGFINPEDSNRVEHLVPEGGPGEDAAGFSARRQQEKFLGGGDTETKLSRAEQTTYALDQSLSQEQIGVERANLLRGFADIFKGDPQIPDELKESFNSDNLVGKGGTLRFERGAGQYSLDIIASGEKGNSLFLMRDDGKIRENLTIGGADEPLIRYAGIDSDKKYDDKTGAGGESGTNIGLAINKGRELLNKVRGDFRTVASSKPAEFTPQEQQRITSTEAREQQEIAGTPTETSDKFLQKQVDYLARHEGLLKVIYALSRVALLPAIAATVYGSVHSWPVMAGGIAGMAGILFGGGPAYSKLEDLKELRANQAVEKAGRETSKSLDKPVGGATR